MFDLTSTDPRDYTIGDLVVLSNRQEAGPGYSETLYQVVDRTAGFGSSEGYISMLDLLLACQGVRGVPTKFIVRGYRNLSTTRAEDTFVFLGSGKGIGICNGRGVDSEDARWKNYNTKRGAIEGTSLWASELDNPRTAVLVTREEYRHLVEVFDRESVSAEEIVDCVDRLIDSTQHEWERSGYLGIDDGN